MLNKTISVLIPVYNPGIEFTECLTSIENQTLRPDEVIIVDDGSDVNIEEFLINIKKIIKLKLIRLKKNVGIAKALNEGLSNVESSLVARIDADDKWETTHLYNLHQKFINNPKCSLAASATYKIDNKNEKIKQQRNTEITDSNIRRKLMWDNPLVHSAVMYKLETCERVKKYNESAKWEDYNLWIKLIELGQFEYSQKPTVHYRISNNSLSRVDYYSAIESRWENQKVAIRKFYKRHPISAIIILIIATIRRKVYRAKISAKKTK